MSISKFFKFKLENILFDLLIFVGGATLAFGKLPCCQIAVGKACPLPLYAQLGLVLMILACMHFIAIMLGSINKKITEK